MAVITAMGLLIISPLPPVSYNLRAHTLLVSFKDLIFLRQQICTELSHSNSLTALHFAALLALGIAGEQCGAEAGVAAHAALLPFKQWKGLCVWSQQQCGWGNLGSAWKYNCRGCRLWWGAEPKRNREPRLSWLPAAGAGRGVGMPFAPLAVPGCSLAAAALGTWLHLSLVGACDSPKRRNVRWLLHQPWAELDVCVSVGQGCAQLGVEFLLLTACILSSCFCPSLLTCFKSFPALILRS